jgi:hypothetical protein
MAAIRAGIDASPGSGDVACSQEEPQVIVPSPPGVQRRADVGARGRRQVGHVGPIVQAAGAGPPDPLDDVPDQPRLPRRDPDEPAAHRPHREPHPSGLEQRR